ncbi:MULTISPECIES: DUF262 domain-containing protein [Pseudoalteromonas]|uniref:DUF262 domain-containing protein n=1 Tax=Pseudoalteromonas TaxID=53246 RepID=UPI000301B646|nr:MULTISPECIES: DUF262 domain-containing protein [Pseudoalteromonas]MCF6146292.1 hypothetical protein [Pseudoalteromonas mariniglutinosa NCIMB 1770]
MNDLLESIPSTNVKIIELYNKVESNSLTLSPDFQRKLVWKKQHKFHFIETVLKNYPFPEVYIASSEMDVTNITSSEIVVDGQQRLSTLVDYIKGVGDFKKQNKVKSFSELSTDEKKLFLNYFVSVRDLKNVDMEIIKDIFMRINNTEYSLNAVEKLNAQYGDSEFVVFCKQLIDEDFNPTSDETDTIIEDRDRAKFLEFFTHSSVFSENDIKRMNNLQFVMTLITTLVESEYFNRNTKVSEYIETFNSNFDRQHSVEESLKNSINMFNAIDFRKGSYWFSKANAFTLLIEFSGIRAEQFDLIELKRKLETLELKSKKYFAGIETDAMTEDEKKYFEYAKEAINEKSARNHRGKLVKQFLDETKINT